MLTRLYENIRAMEPEITAALYIFSNSHRTQKPATENCQFGEVKERLIRLFLH